MFKRWLTRVGRRIQQEGLDASKLSRRDLLRLGALTGGAALLGGCSYRRMEELLQASGEYPLSNPENILYTACLQCNTGCGLKVKILDGVAVKIDGNPRAPHAMYPHLPYETSPFVTASIDGSICPKGQAGLQTVYDPYRIRTVLKRAGKRGENKWVTIPFEQAIKEIVEGGLLFKDVPGEENRHVPGLRDLYALRDPALAKQMAEDVRALKKVIKQVRNGQLPESELRRASEDFKAKYRQHLSVLIDPDHPDLGPKNNQLVFVWGRVKAGREHFIRRFVSDAFGSVNAIGHTTVCQGSIYFTGKAMSEQWDYDPESREVKWTGGKKFYWQSDTGNAEFILFVGASPFEANYGPPGRSVRITQAITEGRMKIAVVDPRFSKTASKAWKWVPVLPGTEGALALGMIRWIIENRRYDARYLTNANKAAANADGEPTFCNATWLVVIDEKGQPGRFLRAHEIGLSPVEKRTAADGTTYDYELFVVLKNGKPIAVDPNDEQNPVEGDLFVDTTLNGIRVKSAFQLLYESASEHTLVEWAEICGIKEETIVELAREFTSHGKRAVAEVHRGVSQHTNGFYNCFAFNTLNLLIGNYDWRGGFIKKAEWDLVGKKGKHKPFLLEEVVLNKLTPFGISIIRHGVHYEETTLFEGYPAKRPFFPLSSDVYQEIFPSIGDAYPYPVKALILHMGSPAYSLPAGHKVIEVISDPEKLPLFIAIDITVGETSLYADYIFPDLTYLERWEFHGSHPTIAHKIHPTRHPIIPPIPETVRIFGEEMPICLESFFLAVAEKLELPCFGKDGFGRGLDFTRMEDFYLKMVANMAVGDEPNESVPEADDAELELFRKSHRHLPKSVFDEGRWKKALGGNESLWRKVVYVLNRGGRFENYEDAYEGDKVKHKYGKLVNLYSEKVATTKNSMTGQPFSGIARYFPITDSLGQPLNDAEEGYDLHLITYREITMTKTRTIGNYWLTSVLPENAVLMNPIDAEKRGIRDGDRVRIYSPSNPEGVWDLRNMYKKPIEGKVKLTEGIRPGIIAFALGFGHWAYGSTDIVIDNKRIPADPRRAKGFHANAVMRIDPHLQDVTLQDLTGGSASFYDSKVRVERI